MTILIFFVSAYGAFICVTLWFIRLEIGNIRTEACKISNELSGVRYEIIGIRACSDYVLTKLREKDPEWKLREYDVNQYQKYYGDWSGPHNQ